MSIFAAIKPLFLVKPRMGQRNPNLQLKTLVDPVIYRFSTIWCRILQPSTVWLCSQKKGDIPTGIISYPPSMNCTIFHAVSPWLYPWFPLKISLRSQAGSRDVGQGCLLAARSKMVSSLLKKRSICCHQKWKSIGGWSGIIWDYNHLYWDYMGLYWSFVAD